MVHASWPGDPERAAPIHRGRRFMVYRVLGARNTTSVVKTPRADRAAPEIEALRHEYRILCELSIFGVSQPLALEEHDEHPALLLEDAGPIDLDAWLGARPADAHRFYRFAIQLCHILAQLHQHDILHQEITPANIVIDPEQQVATLVDFDRAMRIASLERVAPAAMMPTAAVHEQTLPYLAPEQIGAIDQRAIDQRAIDPRVIDRRVIDRRTDLYALGATFYRMLTGAPPAPIRGDSNATRAPPSAKNPALSRVVDDIIRHLLAPDPTKRYSRAEEVIEDLVRAQRNASRYASARARGPEVQGRERAWETLCEALAQTRAGARATCIVSAPRGGGKTALATALRSEVEAAGGRYLSATCAAVDARRGSSLIAAFANGLRAILREREDNCAIRRRIRAALGSRAGWLASQLPELASVLDLPRPLPQLEERTPEGDICVALRDLASALCPPGGPLAIVLDDLHEADRHTLKLLKGFCFVPSSRRWLLVATIRENAITPHTLLADTLDAMQAADPSFAWIDVGQSTPITSLKLGGDGPP